MTVALMWEARAASGRGPELLDWARAQQPAPGPPRREHFTAPGDRVLVITWWDAPYDAELPELPEPPGHLVVRPVHRWRFESADSGDSADSSVDLTHDRTPQDGGNTPRYAPDAEGSS